ncbi:hypothetical protein KAR91_34155 [Candidatus Pacearchaeota archaeon]|nr:hypothetical protein [Candidatus Pacearchaeota archaeon]
MKSFKSIITEENFETFKPKTNNKLGLVFELSGKRGDVQLTMPSFLNSKKAMATVGAPGWDGFINFYADRVFARKIARKIAKDLKL